MKPKTFLIIKIVLTVIYWFFVIFGLVIYAQNAKQAFAGLAIIPFTIPWCFALIIAEIFGYTSTAVTVPILVVSALINTAIMWWVIGKFERWQSK